MVLALVVFFPIALCSGRSDSGASWTRSSQSSLSRSSTTSTVSAWWTLIWHVWHWKPLQAALVDQPLLVFFGGVPCPPDRLVMYVVLSVLVDLFEACCCMFVDLHVVLV